MSVGGAEGFLAVVPLGAVGEMAVKIVAANLQAVLRVPVDILAATELPTAAFETARRQYDAGRLLDHLDRFAPPGYTKVLGLAAADLCLPILTFVFGEAQLGGRAALVSTYRLRDSASGAPVSLGCYYERLAKVALHEAAHTFNLYHCEQPGCLMNFSPNLKDLDRVRLSFCERCEFSLKSHFLRTTVPS